MADNVKNFWGSYRSAVIASGVPEKNADWFVRWTQKFPRSIKGESLQERSAADICRFLMIYTHVLNKPGLAVRSPLDF